MKLKELVLWFSVIWCSVPVAQAQESTNSQALSQQLEELRESFENQQREQREAFEKQQRELREEFDKKFREQQAQIEALRVATNVPPAVAQTNAVIAEQMEELNRKVAIFARPMA